MVFRSEKSILASARITLLRDLYMRMLFARLVDEYAWQASQQGNLGFVASCCGHEAAQVGSAVCIKVGQDFTLPYYRDLGVVLTIGMTPYEVFRTYRQNRQATDLQADSPTRFQPVSHWGYHKHNLVTAPAPVATQILHAAGIAFACKLRKAPAITIAYCGDGATAEPDFLEGITFATQHQLPAIFICEQDCSDPSASSLSKLALPPGLEHCQIDGSQVLSVYTATQNAIERAHNGLGPTLLEIYVTRAIPGSLPSNDPLFKCSESLKTQDAWDEVWAHDLQFRLRREIEQALGDVLREE